MAKYALGIFVGLIFGLTGWVVTVYTKVDGMLLIFAFVLVVICVYSSVLLLRYIIDKIEGLKDL
ncbi:hypothetical protein [Arcobacter sp. FWKO B]|uniref:hypothetical protein n=1 Tax=Arcobacter sp. FWKO B TaxID=2593672 RepID=UPI0018A561AF|nr:hypothetical protein [Arcobacter sp. FWKO B]QOG12682.1 hypothetical protein FWKOB_08200 [Arcobacter sp. FWKO B]